MYSDHVIAALHSRVSIGELAEPAPSLEQREAIFRAGLRAPDHGQLHPWRFLLVEGADRVLVGQILADVEEQCFGPLTESQHKKAAERLLRAPLVLLIVARVVPHPRIPELEQLMSTACAVQNMLVAAHALGVGAMWRTGLVTYEPLLAEKLGLSANDRLLGFLYLGTPKAGLKPVQEVDMAAYFAAWNKP